MPEDRSIKVTVHGPTALDKQVGGSHYKGLAIQPAEYMHKNDIGYLPGNVIKYISRYKQKNGIEDLKKAYHYIEIIAKLEYNVDLKA
jgi:hypothetical protein